MIKNEIYAILINRREDTTKKTFIIQLALIKYLVDVNTYVLILYEV